MKDKCLMPVRTRIRVEVPSHLKGAQALAYAAGRARLAAGLWDEDEVKVSLDARTRRAVVQLFCDGFMPGRRIGRRFEIEVPDMRAVQERASDALMASEYAEWEA